MHGAQRDAATYEDQSPGDVQPLGAARAARIVKEYSPAILLGLAGVILLYAIIATAAYLFAPNRRITAIPFRLNFEGAANGMYPNGTRFSTAEITADPILVEVYQANRLGDMVGLQDFTRRVFVLESNRAFEQLALEYQSKLADPKLSPVDRERLEKEFEQKRASLSKSDYSISFMDEPGTRAIPQTLIKKVLADILGGWAKRAVVEKHALDYRVPVLSRQVIDRDLVQNANILEGAMFLRRRVLEVIRNIDDIQALPGVQLVRTPGDRVSLNEIRIALEDILRFNLEPLISSALSGGGVENPAQAIALVETQLSYDQRILATARARDAALRSALAAYEQGRTAPREVREGTTSTAERNAQAAETVMPQISEGFLDRIVDLATRTADREYRQRIADEIKDAALAVVPAETAMQYDQELLDHLKRQAVAPSNPAAVNRIRGVLLRISNDMSIRVGQVNEIYTIASRQLNPATELYTSLGPPTTHIERGASLYRLLMYGFLVLLLALPFALVLAFIHARVRREEQIEALEAMPEA